MTLCGGAYQPVFKTIRSNPGQTILPPPPRINQHGILLALTLPLPHPKRRINGAGKRDMRQVKSTGAIGTDGGKQMFRRVKDLLPHSMVEVSTACTGDWPASSH
jgi:hypothetical protein